MRYSKQRKVILDNLKSRTDHPTADMVYNAVIKELPGMGIATVYRNLGALADAGIILRIPGKNSPDRFDGNVARHYHIRCSECGRIEDIVPLDYAKFQAAKKDIKDSFGFTDDEVEFGDVVFEHVCCNCRPDSCS